MCGHEDLKRDKKALHKRTYEHEGKITAGGLMDKELGLKTRAITSLDGASPAEIS